MSEEYKFAFVGGHSSTRKDGDTEALRKAGIEPFGFRDTGECLGMNGMFKHFFNEATNGLWKKFLTGGSLTWDSNGRYVVMNDERKNMLPALNEALEKARDQSVLYDFFKKLFDELDHLLKENPRRLLALVIN